MSGMIEVLDEFGNPVQVPRDEYAQQIMGYTRANWDNVDAVRSVVVQMLQGAFYEQALELATRCCQLSNESVNDMYWRAVALAELGRLEAADKEFATIQEDAAYAADQARAAVGRARVQKNMGNIDRASELLNEATDIDPDNPGVLVALCGFWAEQGQPEKGLARLTEMADARPESAAPWRAMAQAAMRRKDDEALRKSVRRAVDLATSEQRAEVLTEMSWVLGEGGLPEDVVSLLEPELSRPTNPQLLMNLAQAYSETGRKEDAVRLLERIRGQLPHELHPMVEMKLRQLEG